MTRDQVIDEFLAILKDLLARCVEGELTQAQVLEEAERILSEFVNQID